LNQYQTELFVEIGKKIADLGELIAKLADSLEEK